MGNDEMGIAQLDKLRAEVRKINAECNKLMVETRWYPLLVASGLVAAVITITKLFL